jgi:ureidoglycolate dehydrogenase (NAD+)
VRGTATMAHIRIPHQDLSRFIAAILVAKGMGADDAATVADSLVWANIRGVDGHGVFRLPTYLDFIDRGELDPRARPKPRAVGPSAFVLDCARAAGPVAMMQAARLAVETARRNAVCIVLVRETTHTGAIGRYPQWAAAQGCAAIMMNGGPPFMAYHGTRTAHLGTSPIAIAVPSGGGEGGEGEPLLVDLATAVVSNGRLRQAVRAGEPIPPGWALDAEGKATTDAAKAAVILPLGGPKGSGLSFMFECLTGILAAAPVLTMFAAPAAAATPRRHRQNAILIALDVAAFRPLEDYRRDIGALAAMLRSQPLQEGFDEMLMPGERGGRAAAERRAKGIPLPASLWTELGGIARALGVSVPQHGRQTTSGG